MFHFIRKKFGTKHRVEREDIIAVRGHGDNTQVYDRSSNSWFWWYLILTTDASGSPIEGDSNNVSEAVSACSSSDSYSSSSDSYSSSSDSYSSSSDSYSSSSDSYSSSSDSYSSSSGSDY